MVWLSVQVKTELQCGFLLLPNKFLLKSSFIPISEIEFFRISTLSQLKILLEYIFLALISWLKVKQKRNRLFSLFFNEFQQVFYWRFIEGGGGLFREQTFNPGYFYSKINFTTFDLTFTGSFEKSNGAKKRDFFAHFRPMGSSIWETAIAFRPSPIHYVTIRHWRDRSHLQPNMILNDLCKCYQIRLKYKIIQYVYHGMADCVSKAASFHSLVTRLVEKVIPSS